MSAVWRGWVRVQVRGNALTRRAELVWGRGLDLRAPGQAAEAAG